MDFEHRECSSILVSIHPETQVGYQQFPIRKKALAGWKLISPKIPDLFQGPSCDRLQGLQGL